MLISEQHALNEYCEGLKSVEFITVDTEFLRERTYYPKLCLIQISGPDGEASAIDPLVEGLNLEPLYDLLFDEDILKVFHAGRQDLEIFFNLTEKVVNPIFDTQIAAMVCGYGDSVGYESLVRNITSEQVDKSSQFTDWSRRPLSKKQLNYALGDVTHLITVYKHLAKELERQGRIEWVFAEEEILNAPETYTIDPYDMWKKVKIRSPKTKNLAVLREVTAWRETRAQNKNLPRSWILKDDTLADIAGQIPKNLEALSKIRNIPKDIQDRPMGKTLLSLIDQALKSNPEGWPKVEKRKPLPPSVGAVTDVLKMLLKLQSAEYGVATKLIASSKDLEALAQDDDADIPAMSGWRREVFGQEALDLKNGRLAIGLENSKIKKFKL